MPLLSASTNKSCFVKSEFNLKLGARVIVLSSSSGVSGSSEGSGGVSSLVHLKMLKQLGAEGAIVGRALYTGDINLKQAIAAFS